MKRVINLLMILLIGLCVFGCSKTPAGNEPQNNNAPETSEPETEWLCTKEIYYNSDGKISSYDVIEYDENGNFVKVEEYDADNKLVYIGESTYDDKGNEVLYVETEYESEGEFRYKTEYEYDEKNQLIRETSYFEDGTVAEYYTYEYDSNGNRIHAVNTAPDGELYLETVTEYDDKGRVTKHYTKVEGYGDWVQVYEYNGDFIEKVCTYSDGETVDRTDVYAYKDQNPDLIETISCYDASNNLYYKIEYRYDEYGNEISSAEFDASGNMKTMVEYEFTRK